MNGEAITALLALTKKNCLAAEKMGCWRVKTTFSSTKRSSHR